VAWSDPATLFDFVEEPLDQIPGTVEIRAEADRLDAIASWRMLAQTPLSVARALIQAAS
jgi:hypothetical protein